MILQARQLAFGYPGREVGRDVDLALTPGRALALLGPNGGGKTTLLKTLLGLLPPLGGEVLLDGRPLGSTPVRDRARLIGYVPQVHLGTFAFSVADVVLMGRTAHHGPFTQPSARDREVAAGAIDRFGLTGLAERPYTMISGGERQLVLIARALAQEPRLVVLDEPTASLDFGNQGRVLGEIRSLTRAGLAVLFTTHDPNHALRVADEVATLRAGRLLAHGPAAEVVTRAHLENLYDAPVREVGSAPNLAFVPDHS
ncbi:ATP-binding cassette domain-containing protein [Enterovirga aerilata]|uniref:ABC transporter ATP-binding protein n=1 Tax=Enterovirga aerilata TaxID=2730920 RepID=A0A849IEZ4_9HYPH|nr:ABC transporter ATP-binding protein [Enterovirga sp. DB1703]